MATYEYRCARCGRFETAYPLGTAPPDARCPQCDNASHRVFTMPHVSLLSKELGRAHERAEKTRDEPEIVSEIPAGPHARPARHSRF